MQVHRYYEEKILYTFFSLPIYFTKKKRRRKQQKGIQPR